MKLHPNIALYMVKVCLCCAFVFLARPWLPAEQNRWTWIFISMILVQSPDSNEALPLAINRAKANVVAGVCALLAVLVGLSGPIGICIAFCATIAACALFGLMQASRPALAAVIIILLHPEGAHPWDTALARCLDVLIGCLAGLLITVPFHWRNYRELLRRRAAVAKVNPHSGEA